MPMGGRTRRGRVRSEGDGHARDRRDVWRRGCKCDVRPGRREWNRLGYRGNACWQGAHAAAFGLWTGGPSLCGMLSIGDAEAGERAAAGMPYHLVRGGAAAHLASSTGALGCRHATRHACRAHSQRQERECENAYRTLHFYEYSILRWALRSSRSAAWLGGANRDSSCPKAPRHAGSRVSRSGRDRPRTPSGSRARPSQVE